MNHNTHTANPFYASRLKRVAPRTEERDRPVYARLPLAPRNAVPVPHLTSLYHFHRAGEYGDRSGQAIAAATSSKICCCISSRP